MGLKAAFSRAARKLGLALSCLCLLFLAACGPQHLGSQAEDPALHGTTAITQVYTDSGPENVLTVDGSHLKAGETYAYNGTLVVKGDVPAKTEIDVYNGKLEVTGNVGDKAELDVKLPVRTHEETTIMLMPMTMSCGNNCTTTYLMPMPVTSTIEDGLLHPGDYGAAVKVDGAIGNKVSVTTNGGIEAGSWGVEFHARTSYGRTLQQVPAPQKAAPQLTRSQMGGPQS
jgi:hypothetical protein